MILTRIQKLEAFGFLPYNKEVSKGKIVKDTEEKKIMTRISIQVGGAASWQALEFLMDANYLINYGAMSVAAAKRGHLDFLKAMHNYNDGLICFNYILENAAAKGITLVEEVLEYLTSEKEAFDSRIAEMYKDEEFEYEDWYCPYTGWHYTD